MAETFENNRKQNLQGLWSNPRKRGAILFMGALVLAMLIVGFVVGGKEPPATTGTETVDAPTVQARPGEVADQDYVKAVRDENQERLAKAQKEGRSVLPTLEGPSQAPSLDPLSNAPQGTPQAVVPQPVTVPPPSASVPPPSAPPAAPAPAVDVTRGPRYKSVESQILGYMRAWAAPTGAQEFAYNGMRPEAPAVPAAPAAPIASGDQSSGGSNGGGARFVRAGTVVPAVLLTSINSDTPGPVLAQITSGPLVGARLIGSFQATEKQVVVQFRLLSMPGQPRSYAISAYAVGDTTLSTGLATDVNNHYFRRYGLLLAAGFIQGYGQAVARSGTTTTITDGGGVVVTQDELNAAQIRKVALGQAGSSIASDLQQETNVRPTVKVEGKNGSGVPIGLLFMSDF